MNGLFLFLLVAMGAAGAADKDTKNVLSTFRREAIQGALGEQILRLTPEDSPARATFLVPVKNTKRKPTLLQLYLYRPGDRPTLLSDPRGLKPESGAFDTLVSLVGEDQDGDGLIDVHLVARFKGANGKPFEKSAKYRNEGPAGFRLLTAPPPPAAPKTGFALGLDCRYVALDGGWWVAACKEGEAALEVRLKLNGEVRLAFEAPNATSIMVEGQDSRAVAISYDGPGCRIVKILRLKDGRLVSDTDCAPSTQCALTRFPKVPDCRGTVECGGVAGDFRWKREFDVCQ